jgi:maltodextrin utilization protein YvdJ
VDNIDGELSKIDANNLRIKIEEKQMTVSKADETIQQLINDQWLKENEVRRN